MVVIVRESYQLAIKELELARDRRIFSDEFDL